MPLHRADQPDDRLAAHQAVRIEDQHLRISGAEPAHPVGDVAGLAFRIGRPPAIEDARMAFGALAQLQECGFLGDPDGRIGGVAEDEDVEAVDRSDGFERLVHGAQRRGDAGGRFIVCRHEQRGARRQFRQRRIRVGAQTASAAGQQRPEAGERAGERERDPGEQRDEQPEHQHPEQREPVHRDHPIHLVGGLDSHGHGRTDHREPAEADGARRRGRPLRLCRRCRQRLHRIASGASSGNARNARVE